MMFWRKKNNPPVEPTIPPAIAEPLVADKIEIQVAKEAGQEAVTTAKKVNAHVNDLLEQNGIIVTIVLAAHNPSTQKKSGV